MNVSTPTLTCSNKILFIVRPDLDSKPGGDTIQIHQTRIGLQNLGHQVDILSASSLVEKKNLQVSRNYDLLHFFNLPLADQYSELVFEACKKNIPCVLSPIFWDMREYEIKSSLIPSSKRTLLTIISRFPKFIGQKLFSNRLRSIAFNPFYVEYLRKTLLTFSLLLPNSSAELYSIQERFRINIPFVVVRNAARITDKTVPLPFKVPDKFILCVGRIEYRKNQLQLIKALDGLGLSLVLVGDINSSEKKYWKQCLQYAAQLNIELVHIPNQSFEIVTTLYSKALMHVQPSWFETPGLSILEAAATGCPIICTQVGSASEYFGDNAEYCSPESYESIRNAIVKTMSKSRDSETLKKFIRNNFTWDKAAHQTHQAYELVLQKRSKHI